MHKRTRVGAGYLEYGLPLCLFSLVRWGAYGTHFSTSRHLTGYYINSPRAAGRITSAPHDTRFSPTKRFGGQHTICSCGRFKYFWDATKWHGVEAALTPNL